MAWWKGVGSLKVSVVLLFLLFSLVLGGTLAQAAWGTSALQTTLFSQLWFPSGGLWWPGLPSILVLLGVNLSVGAWVHLERTVRHLGLWGLHLAMVVFCFGSLGLSLAQEELVLGLLPGASANRAFVKNSQTGETRPLPFTLTVNVFRTETYPESVEPSDYISTVTVALAGREEAAEIRMNQPLRRGGWTVYQSSVETVDGTQAPVFKLMHNPWAPFPYVVSVLVVASLLLHGLVGRRKGARFG